MCDFSDVELKLFRREETIAEIANRWPVAVPLRLAACLQIILLIEILLEGTIRVIPRPKIMQVLPDLLGPSASGMREQWKIRIWFLWFLFCLSHPNPREHMSRWVSAKDIKIHQRVNNCLCFKTLGP